LDERKAYIKKNDLIVHNTYQGSSQDAVFAHDKDGTEYAVSCMKKSFNLMSKKTGAKYNGQ
jgi:hypothetical protein